MSTDGNVQFFNLETMSGVFSGSHTQVYQRFQVLPIQPDSTKPTWLQLLWYDAPPACVAYSYTPGEANNFATALLRIPDPFAGEFQQRLQTALNSIDLQMQSCGSCSFWQASTAQNPDHLPVGYCQWQQNRSEKTIAANWLRVQSTLALACVHWQVATQPQKPFPEQSQERARSDAGATLDDITIAPMRKAAETAGVRLRWRQRLVNWFSRRHGGQRRRTNWLAELVERSGVGAGVESCFVCQGRIANLGALAVATPEGDKETFSIWRCRNCYTFYLNDWVDRWERLDSLETEETYYRIAPAEAVELLQIITGVEGGDHPGRRQERTEQRAKLFTFLAGRAPFAHQVRLGR